MGVQASDIKASHRDREIGPLPVGTPVFAAAPVETFNPNSNNDHYKSLFQAAMETSSDAYIVYSSDGIATWCNRHLSVLFGVDDADIIGRTHSDPWCFFVDDDNLPIEQYNLPVSVAMRTCESVQDVSLGLIRPGGERRVLLASVQMLPGVNRVTHGGALVCYRDITERSWAEEALRASEERWQLAVLGSTDGIWDWDIASGTVFFSDRSREILACSHDEFPVTITELKHRIHPDDEPWFADALDAHTQGLTPVFTCEFRILDTDGFYQWVLARGTALLDRNGVAYRMAGSFTDIRERKYAEERLVASNSRFEALIRDLKTGVLVEDTNRQVVLANQAFCDLMNIDMPPAAIMGANCVRTFYESKDMFADPEGYLSRITEILHVRTPVNSEEIQLKDGKVFERDYVPVFLTEEYGGHYWMYRDITERKQFETRIRTYNSVLEEQRRELEHANELLAGLAATDGLTGVRNRRAFEDRLNAEFQRSRRHKSPLCLIMLDVDKFKQFNDTFGHIEGDAVLKVVASVLESNGREYDLVARYGGEEFVVILPETVSADAVNIAERFRSAIEAWPWDKRQITASFGVAELPLDMADPSVALAEADAAMYRSKQAGRNLVTLGVVEKI